MRLQEAIPALTANKELRIPALQTATATAGRKLSPAEIEALDDDLRDLQIEFADAIRRLEPRVDGGTEPRPPYGTIKPRIIQKPQPSYLVFTLQTPLSNETLSPQPFTKIIEDAVRENNQRADAK